MAELREQRMQGLSVVPDVSVTRTLRGKRILFTGATGFVGKVTLSMLLTRFPEVGKVYVMARPGVSTSADDRFFGKVVVAPPFDPLRAQLGSEFDAFIREKCEPVAGDVSKPWCGLDEGLLARLEGQVDLVINSAGLVDFNPTLEAGLNANALGAVYVARTAHRLGAKLLHVSTCFVAGNRQGFIEEEEELVGYFPKREELPGERFDPFAEIEDCKAAIARIKKQVEDRALISRFRSLAAERLHEEGRDPGDERALRTGMARERKLWVTDALVREGMERSRQWGWPNTYCYTKSIGDQVIDAISQETGLEFSIARPAIVESALRFPFPGWNEGFTTTAPLTFLALKGHRTFVAKPGLVLDVIPVDHIAAGVIAAGAALLAGKGRKVYQLGTSDTNPLRVDRAIELTGLFRRRYYLERAEQGDRLRNELLARMEPQTAPLEAFRKLSAPQISKLAKAAVDLLDDVKPSWGAPRIGASIERLQDGLERVSRQAEMASQLFEIFVPFVWENTYVFSTRNIAELYARMDPEDAERIPWDPDSFDWLHYWLDIHLRGLERWVYPNLEDEFGARAQKRGVPVHRDLWSLLEARVRRHPGKVAMRFLRADGGADRYTYEQLRDRAVRASLYLEAAGVDPADRVLLVAENRPEWAMAFFGIVKAGATVVPLDAESTRTEVERILASAEAKHVVASESVAARLRRAGFEGQVHRFRDLFEGWVGSSGGTFEPRAPVDPASLIFTSGTTGRPKGVMLSGRNFTSLVSRLSTIFQLGERDGLLSVLPLHHTFEFTTGLLLPLAVGAEIAYLEERTAETISDAFRSGRITAMVGVPAVWQLLLRSIEGELDDKGLLGPAQVLRSGALAAADATGSNLVGRAAFLPVHRRFGGRLRFLISGGAAMPQETYEAFRGMGFEILEGYGLTEAAPVLTVQAPGNQRPGQVGKAVPGVEVRIHRPDADGVGEIVAKGPNVMMGYWRDPEATAEALRDGWLHTGDLGRLDEDGNLIIVGRQKDVIIDASGKNVHPDELEEVYGTSPLIEELSIVGLPAEGGGERIACLAVPARSEGTTREEAHRQVEAHVRNVSLRLPVWKRVKVLHLWDEPLPKTATQKVKRQEVVRILERLEARRSDRRAGSAAPSAGPGWLHELVARVSEQPLAKVTPDARLEADLGFDSLTFTELGAALEEAGVRLPSAEELLSVGTVEDLDRLVRRVRRSPGPRPEERTSEGTRRRKGTASRLLGPVLDWVQPAAERVPLLASALHVARTEGIEVLDDYFTRPRKENAEEADSIDLPGVVVAAGKSLLRGGQHSLYENFFETRILGRAHIPQHTNFLVAANHASHLDMGLVKHALGGQGDNLVALAARDYFFSDRWRKTYFENFTQLIPMDRHGSLRESLALASRTLRQGRNLLIFPEGTRATDGELKEFKGSLGYLALTNRVGILPMYLDGTFEALPKGAVVPKGRKLEVRIAPFLSYEDIERMVEGLPRSEQHREVARWVEGTIRALRDGRRPPTVRGAAVADADEAVPREGVESPGASDEERARQEAAEEEIGGAPKEREA